MGEDARGNGLCARLGSLPPHVEGKVNGYLSMIVDNFSWRGELNGKVNVFVSWWGEKQKIVFVPQVTDVSNKCHVSFNNTYVYRIVTNTELFLSYLQDCEELNFEVFEQGNDCLLGTATLKHLMSIILNNPLTESCVVIDKNGTEIADLSVSFVFHQNISTCGVNETKNSSRRTLERINCCDETFTNKVKSSNCVDGETCFNYKYSSSLPQSKFESLEIEAEKSCVNVNETTDVVSNSTISELLEQCYNIRQEYHSNERKITQSAKKIVEKSFTSQEQKIRDYSPGGKMNRGEELAALETVKFRSPIEESIQLTESLNQSFDGNVECGDSYVKIPQDNLHVSSQESFFRNESGDYNAFEKQRKDSRNEERKNEVGNHSNAASEQNRNIRFLHLTIQTLSLNYVGMQRVLVLSRALSSSTRVHNSACGQQLPSGFVYFLEYEIPQYLRVHSNNSQKIKRPWNCNVYRMCSRQKSGKCIHFHRQMIHMLASQKARFRELLCSSSITFKVYSRHVNQRLPCLIGKASLPLGKIVEKFTSQALLELSIHPQSEGNASCLLSLGILKLKVEFGSSRTCFEKKMISSVNFQSVPSSSESEYDDEDVRSCTIKMSSKSSNLFSKKQNKHGKVTCDKHVGGTSNLNKKSLKVKIETSRNISRKCDDKKEILLFGLLHVSSGRDFKSSCSYIVSHGFWKEDVMTSDICWQSNNPVFKFHKIMPVLLTLDLLDRCYNNFMVVEVWCQSGVVGIAKLPLNQFYIAFRDPPVVEQLLTSKYPIISVDGWVDVIDPASLRQVGKLNVVLALGTENQIQMLEMSRCMKDSILNPQNVSQSFPTELDHIISRSTTPANSVAEKESVLKVRHGECSQNEKCIQGYNNHSVDKPLQEIESIISRESLLVSGNYSKEYLQKLICEDSSQDEHFSERKSLSLQSSQNSRIFRTESFPKSFCDSSVDDRMRVEEISETSLIQDTCTINAVDSIEKLKRNYPDLSSNQILRNVSQPDLNFLPKLHSGDKVQMHTQISSGEIILDNAKNVANVFEESDSSPFNEEIQILKRKCGKVATDTTTDLINVDKRHRNKICDLTPHNSSEEDLSFIGKPLNTLEESSVGEKNYSRKEVEKLPNETQNISTEDLYKSLTTADLNNISENSADLRSKEARGLPTYQLCKSVDSCSFTGVTENASTQTDILSNENFFAVIEVINALYIPSLDNDNLPNCYVTLHTANNSVMSTPVISENTDPVWNWSCEVWLPVILLENNGRRLILKVWHKKDDNCELPNAIEDLVIGFVALDLQVLVCGLPCISGWFNICDLSGSCKGQIQICVTPLENVSSLLNKTHCKDIKGKDTEDFTEPAVTHFLQSTLQKSSNTISQELVFAENNTVSTSTSNVKANISSSELNPEAQQPSHVDRKLVGNEFSKVCYNPNSKIDTSPSKFSDFPSVCAKQMHSENPEKNSKSVIKHVHSGASNCEQTLPHVTKQSFSENVHYVDNVNSSSLMETLREKFQELDNIIQQMRSKSDSHAKTTPRNVYSEEILRTNLTDRECNGEPVPYYKAPSINISQGEKSDDFFCSNYNKFSAVKESVSKNEHSESRVSCLLPSQESKGVIDNSSSPITVPTRCMSATINECKSSREEDKCTVPNVSDDVSVTGLMTDHLMYEALHELDLENIFNPLLFQHILANHQCQRCCSQWCGETNKSLFSSQENDHSSLLHSKRDKKHYWKSQKLMKILSSISDEPSVDMDDPVLSSMDGSRRNSVRNKLLSNLTGQELVDTSQIHGGKGGVTFIANTESSVPFVEANSELSCVSECLNTQNVGTNLNSHKTKHSGKPNSEEEDCVKSIEFLKNSKHLCHPSGEFECASLNSEVNSPNHKILNASSMSDAKDKEEFGISNSEVNRHSSTKHPTSFSTVSLETSFTLDLFSQGIKPSDAVSKRPDKVDSKQDLEQEKERVVFSNNLEGYPNILNENEMMHLVNKMKHIMNG